MFILGLLLSGRRGAWSTSGVTGVTWSENETVTPRHWVRGRNIGCLYVHVCQWDIAWLWSELWVHGEIIWFRVSPNWASGLGFIWTHYGQETLARDRQSKWGSCVGAVPGQVTASRSLIRGTYCCPLYVREEDTPLTLLQNPYPSVSVLTSSNGRKWMEIRLKTLLGVYG
jgi:hypothetical protein